MEYSNQFFYFESRAICSEGAWSIHEKRRMKFKVLKSSKMCIRIIRYVIINIQCSFFNIQYQIKK